MSGAVEAGGGAQQRPAAAARSGRRIAPELRSAIIAAAASAECLGDIARALGCGDWTVKHVLDQHDPAIAPAIAARGLARRTESNRLQAEAMNAARAEAAALARQREAEASRPPCPRATPALWALRSQPELFARLGVQGEPETEAEARVAIGLAGELRGVGDVSVSMAIGLAGASA
ncbi:hypothetical protein SAMN05444336_112101 [Albimonas donghaensis]|uniref:Homeodomain-like domain-containing protein n=1 Tax=Albimonas donghaensis TaxID=356660 RepID=A0A1H3FG23_9RHOB|nr:hypothetical protein [Albimonas donghaensis]SDX89941.1 hypothetical protein SAMN05444336_112101 [Albimonas donghaensis]